MAHRRVGLLWRRGRRGPASRTRDGLRPSVRERTDGARGPAQPSG